MSRVRLVAQGDAVAVGEVASGTDVWTLPPGVYYLPTAVAMDLGVPATYPCFLEQQRGGGGIVVRQIVRQVREANPTATAPSWSRFRHGSLYSEWVAL